MFTIGGTSNRGFYSFEPTGSLRFEDGDSPNLSRTPTTAGNRKKWTFSCWVKLGNLTINRHILGAATESGGNQRAWIFLTNSDTLTVSLGNTSNSAGYEYYTNAKLRDPSAWYHITVRIDTDATNEYTGAEGTNRIEIFINGELQSIVRYRSAIPSGYSAGRINSTVIHWIGRGQYGSYADEYLAEIFLCDGQYYAPTEFAESKNGVWVPKDAKGSLTFGTNGFYLPFNSTVTSEGQSTVLYEGTGANRSVEGFGYKPDMVWLKNRTGTAYQHQMYDRVRGSGAKILPSTTSAQSLDGTGVHSFNDDGISMGTNAGINTSGSEHVAWAWDAGADQTPTGFGCVAYTGSGNRRPVRDVGFTPDLVWIKERTGAENHRLFDSVRGATKLLHTNNTSTEATNTQTLLSFDGDGFTLGTNAPVNNSGDDYVAWCWDAGDGDPVSNTDGSTTTTVKASDAHGFSIVTYQGNSTVGNTIGHGLNGTPDVMFIKGLDNTQDWTIYHKSLSATTKGLRLNSTSAEHQPFQANQMTATTMGLDGSSSMNGSGLDYVAYFWKEVSGYSKFDSYTGTGSSGNAVTGLGFRPAWVMVKRSDSTSDWTIFDNQRDPFYDGTNNRVWANLSTAESTTANYMEFTSDGFTLKAGDAAINASSGTYIYMAFAGGLDTIAPVNTDGDIDSRVKASDDTGFSIVRYEGTGTAGDTVGHGLSAAPDWIVTKRLDSTSNWLVYHSAITDAEDKYLTLETSNAVADNAGPWNDTAPTSSVFSVGAAAWTNTSGGDYVAYCWKATTGKSAFGSYTGNGQSGASGPSVTGLGFEPALIIIKSTDTANGWVMIDNFRDSGIEDKYHRVQAESSAAETTDSSTIAKVAFTSDGFDVTGGSGTLVNTNNENYIYMAFADGRDASFFHDESGQDNHFDPANVQNYDLVPDSPTNGFCTYNPIVKTSMVLSEGNLKASNTAAAWHTTSATFYVSSGKWYWEVRNTSGNWQFVGIVADSFHTYTNHVGITADSYSVYNAGGNKYNNNSSSSYSAGWGAGDIIGVALDMDAGTLTYYKNGASLGTAFTGLSGAYAPAESHWTQSSVANFGQDDSFAGTVTPGGYTDANERGSFKYPVPDGFLSLCSRNLPEPAISPANGQEPADYFNTVAYSGNNTQLSVTGVGFEPNWTWIKKRNGAASHALQDSVRGSFRYLVSNSTAAENTNSGNDWFRSFDSDGFTVSKTTTGGTATTEWNNSGDTYVSWNWLAGGTAVSNTDGSITSSVSANTKAGFSVVSYTGDGTASTIGHGLDSAPEMYIIKDRESTDNWVVYHKDLTSASYYLTLDTTNAQASNNVVFNGTDPTSSVFSVGTSRSTNGNDFIAYCFHSVPGYSLVSSYSGNSSSDGVFVHCGFKPAFVIIKVASVANRWVMFDNKRSDENPVEEAQELNPNDSTAESSSGTDCLDFLSNGFKLRRTGDVFNTSGYNYIFIAFAEQPFKYAQAR